MDHAAEAPAWAIALQESGLGHFIRGSLWIYPFANVAHVLGLVLLVGPIVALDLRLLGAGRSLPVPATSRFLTPFAVVGLLVLVPSGFTLFVADAASLAANVVMQIKIGLALAGVVNALAFRALWSRRLAMWDADPPPAGRAQAVLSIAIWLTVPTLGRLIAYF